MSIDSATVRHIARLARLGIADGDVAPMAVELARVLELADQLAAAHIDGVEPLAHPHEQPLSWRSDTVSESDNAVTFLALAPDARGGLYVVPKVIE
ncbi:MAG: Asp-tRNA(Asn)/Glu-tRNA(Gln) amidotransferase subunit GatC [Rudaea sp.]